DDLHIDDIVKVFSPEGDPRKASTPLNSAFIFTSKFTLGPTYLSGFASTEPITVEEFNKLEGASGMGLSKNIREQIGRATHRMILGVALKARLPDWKEFEQRLKAIVEKGKDCIKAAKDFIDMTHFDARDAEASEGILSVERVLKT